jgi:hypothetical protein
VSDDLAAPQRRGRGLGTPFGLVLSLLASLLIVGFIVAVVVRPDPGGPPPVDYQAAAAAAQSDLDERLLAPDLPEGWSANRAELVTGAADDVIRWEIGFLTPGGEYIGFVQGIDANPSWVADRVARATAEGERSIGGLRWAIYDRRHVDDPGNIAFALVTEAGASTLVLAGTATDAEFEVLASALSEEVAE